MRLPMHELIAKCQKKMKGSTELMNKQDLFIISDGRF